MIRKWTAKSLDPVLTLWLESTTFAHPFIDELYWHDSLALVRDVYLPAAQTWVWEENDTLLGFISVMDNQFVGALFVAPQALHRGIGSALLNEVKQRYPMLSLEVYQKNGRAVNFYHALGFRIEDGAWQEETKHPTWIMRWQADQTPLS
ncbi:N-acetyltransferase [Pseudocitrobacter faecalis]|uniref:N-acetyltransferase n=1 Tax=Pseudocitrobacter faecalis TaxID=1398493 RepID=UPI003BA342D3